MNDYTYYYYNHNQQTKPDQNEMNLLILYVILPSTHSIFYKDLKALCTDIWRHKTLKFGQLPVMFTKIKCQIRIQQLFTYLDCNFQTYSFIFGLENECYVNPVYIANNRGNAPLCQKYCRSDVIKKTQNALKSVLDKLLTYSFF